MKKTFFIILMCCLGMAANTGAVELSGGELHGFISQGYLDSDDNNFLAHNTEDGTFAYREMGLNYNKWLTSGLTAGFQLFAKDLGKTGNNEVKLDWAMLNYRWQPWLGVKAGRLKIKRSLYNDTRDIDMVRPWVLLPQSCYLEYFRDPQLSTDGASLYGTVPAGGAGAFSYAFQYGTTEIETGRDNSMSRYIEDTVAGHQGALVEIKEIKVDEQWIMDLEWETPLDKLSFVDGFMIGGSYTDSDLSYQANYLAGGSLAPPITPPVISTTDGFGFTTNVSVRVDPAVINSGDPMDSTFKKFKEQIYYMKYTFGNLEVMGECRHQQQEQKITVYPKTVTTTTVEVIDPMGGVISSSTTESVSPPTPYSLTTKTDSLGFFLGAAYRFCDWFQLGGYYSEGYPDKDEKDGDDLVLAGRNDFEAWLKDYCLSLRFDVGDNWIFKLEDHIMNGAAFHDPLDNPKGYDEHWNLFAAKATYMF